MFKLRKGKLICAILTILLFELNVGLAQKVDLKTIQNKLELADSGLIIINGIPYDLANGDRVDSVLNLYSNEYLVEMIKFKNEGQFPHLQHNEIAIVLFTYQQDKKKIKQTLKELRTKFPDKYNGFSQHVLDDSKNPVLLINNKQIHHTEAKAEIEKLKTKDIYYIQHNQNSVSSEIYGQNAKNGLVRIWLNYNSIKHLRFRHE